MRIPDHLLALAGRTAWDGPAFRLEAATLIDGHFRSRLIAPPDGLPAPRVFPAVMWMLVATSRIPMPLPARLGLAYRHERRALERLRAFAHAAIDEMALPGDFWSQWVAWHAERRFGPPELPEWLSSLRTMDGAAGPGAAAPGRREPAPRTAAPESLAAACARTYCPGGRAPFVPMVRLYRE